MEIRIIQTINQRKRTKYLRIDARRQLPWLVLAQKELCFFCDVRIELGINATTEHIRPLSDGGDNRESNNVAACKACNYKRNIEYQAAIKREARYAMAEAIVRWVQGHLRNGRK